MIAKEFHCQQDAGEAGAVQATLSCQLKANLTEALRGSLGVWAVE